VQSLSFCFYHAALDLAFSSLYRETTQKRHKPSYLLDGNSKDGEDCISVITLQMCNCAITFLLHLPRSAGPSLQLSHETTQKRHEPSYLLDGNSKDGDHSLTYQITRDTCTYPAGSAFLTTFLTFELNEVRAWLCVVESRGGEREPGYGVKLLKV